MCVYQLLRFAGLPGFHLVCAFAVLALFCPTLFSTLAVNPRAMTTITISVPVKTFGTSLSACDNASTIRSLVIAAKSELLLEAKAEESLSKLLPLLPTKA